MPFSTSLSRAASAPGLSATVVRSWATAAATSTVVCGAGSATAGAAKTTATAAEVAATAVVKRRMKLR
ncbi:hypothetical protein FEK33_09095 [Nocardia asteroides NBRC 15531]|nr:hypothetical protein FEK33_09095 [Nocardia asteroides NBRC 15531]